MAHVVTTPKKWRISQLLETGVQPFDDLPDDELEALASGIKKGRALAVPVMLTSDGFLIDGHQRLRILYAQGVRTISERDVRIVPEANVANALEWATIIGWRRRQLGPEDKGRVALKLMRTYGWSQGRVADVLKVHRPQVSRWLKAIGASAEADDEDLRLPELTEGLDGHERGTAAIVEANRGRPPAKPRPEPWSRRGDNYKSVGTLTKRLQAVELVDPLTADERVVLAERLEDMVHAAESMVAYLRGVE